tara:strand:- start:337 stop:738 length:402 start_codon:yes stop_codon:yes gene_type:complete
LNSYNFTTTITRDPELRQTSGGKQVCNLAIAIPKRDRDKPTVWGSVAVWGKYAESLAGRLSKGSRIIVSNAEVMGIRSYQKKDGTTGTELELGGYNVTVEQRDRDQQNSNPRAERPQLPTFSGPPADDDDIPF